MCTVHNKFENRPKWVKHFAWLFVLGWLVGQASVALATFEDIQRVPDKTAAARKQALATALERVLVKTSGDKNVLSQPVLRKQAAQPERFLQAYAYTPASKAQANNALWQLHIIFERGKIEQLLKQNGYSIWSAKRPTVLVWWVLSDDTLAQSSEIVGDDSASDLKRVWDEQASRRGLPTLFPMTDLATLSQLDASDVWQLNQEKLDAAAKRYAADEQVVFTLRPNDGGQWQGQLTRLTQEGDTPRDSWRCAESTPEACVRAMVDSLTDALAMQHVYAGSARNVQEMVIVVGNIRDGSSYLRISDYLNGLAVVQSVLPLSMNGDKARFQVHFRGDELALMHALVADNVLASVEMQPYYADTSKAFKFIG